VLNSDLISKKFRDLQDAICSRLEAEGGGRFAEDAWTRPGGGGGRSRITGGSGFIEKGGVNFSEVFGETPAALRQELGSRAETFYATGVSLVLHPVNPHVPIVHMNVRYFETSGDSWWFGGGIDLTPHYVRPADAASFHKILKYTCDRFDLKFYPEFKSWADDYFFIPHRNETRGVGGIFFDRLNQKSGYSRQELFDFAYAVGEALIPCYLPLVRAHRDEPYSEEQREWQLLRRGRYVEFNLVHDRGTRFGLETRGRTESILMSLPPLARWEYDDRPQAGSAEERTLQYLKKGIDWTTKG
jgi:coproporphyrinogen III oxidase